MADHEPPIPDSLHDVLAAAATYTYDATNHAFADGAGVLRYPLLAQAAGASVQWVVDTPASQPTLPAAKLDATAYALLHGGTMAPDGSNRFVCGRGAYALVAEQTSLGLTAVAVPA